MTKNNNFLSKMQQLFDKDLQYINQIIKDNSNFTLPLIENIITYLISSSGKKIRPIIIILTYKLLAKNNNDDNMADIYYIMTACEIIHSATLLHDDVIDDANERRGKKTINNIWGNKIAILAGDYLLSLAFIILNKLKDNEILLLFSKASEELSRGEMMQIEKSYDINLTKEKYIEIINLKTSSLFKAGLLSSFIISGYNKDYLQKIKILAKNIGLLFQISDDMLDYFSINNNQIGKKIGSDFYEGKVTLPIILLYDIVQNNPLDINVKNKLINIFDKNYNRNKENFDYIVNLFKEYKIKLQIKEMIDNIIKESIIIIDEFQDNEYKDLFKDLIYFIIDRDK